MTLPLVLGLILSILLFNGAHWARNDLNQWFDDLADNPNLNLNYRKDAKPLVAFL